MSVVTDDQVLGPCGREMKIEIPAPAVDAERGRVVKDLARRVRVPGFRKGKTPPKMVERKFAGDIENELVERLVPRYLKQAEAEKGIKPLLPAQVKDLEVEPGKPMTFVARMEVRPALEVGELAPFDLPETPEEPTEAEVDAALEDLRRSRATWTEVDRPSAVGDRVTGTVGLPAAEDGSEAEEDERGPLRFRLEIGGEGVDERLALALTGAKAGGTVRVDELPGREEPGPFRLDVETVEERELPELDDALAKEVGEFESLDDLREAVTTQIRISKRQDRRMQREKALMDELRKRFPFGLPERVVGRELERMLHEYADQLVARGVDIEAANVPWEKIQADLKPRAEERVHARLVLDAIADDRGVQVDEKELEGILGRLAARENVSSQSLRQHWSRTGQLESLRGQLRRESLVRSLLGEDEDGAGESEAGTEGA